MCGAYLGRIDIGKGDQEAVPDTEDQSAEIDDALVRCSDLDRTAEGGEQTGEPEGRLASEEVGEDAGCKG